MQKEGQILAIEVVEWDDIPRLLFFPKIRLKLLMWVARTGNSPQEPFLTSG